MRIIGIRPLEGPGALARVDVELNEFVRLYNLVLRKGADGKFRTFAPSVCGKHAASFHPALAEQITTAAEAALRAAANDRT